MIMSDSLRTIDGHEVLESQRQSLLRLQVGRQYLPAVLRCGNSMPSVAFSAVEKLVRMS